MKNIPKILLRSYLRRRPVHIRMARFNFLARYSWLKNLLDDLRPELFPPEPALPAAAVVEPELDFDAIVEPLLNAEVRGRQGIYRVERWLGQRGQGYLFVATKLGAKQSVVLKEFLLPARIFNVSEARQRQQRFVNLAGLARSDGRGQDLRVVQPLDAIADTYSEQRCYLITDERDASLTLRQQLAIVGHFEPQVVRQILEQVLQTLLHLHQQAILLPSGQQQFGLVHGNLSLDSLLWVDYGPRRWFVYLTDLALWERLFDPPTAELYTVMVTPDTVNRDLVALGQLGYTLLTGQPVPHPEVPLADWAWPSTDPYLNEYLKKLQTPYAFTSAEAAWQELLQLPTLAPPVYESVAPEMAADTRKPLPRWLLALASAVVLAVVAVGVWQVFFRRAAPATRLPQACCLAEVGAIPEGEFVYTALAQGTWSHVLAQQNLGQQGQTLKGALQTAHPQLTLTYIPVTSVQDAIAAILTGPAEFAIMPRFPDLELPSELGAEVIAYDGLAVFVPFSYAERSRGLPQALGGALTLEQLNDIYVGKVETWREVSRTWLPIKRYAPENIEAIRLFEQRVIAPLGLERLPELTLEPTFPMLRTILQDFETEQLGGIGFAPLSQVFGQCSVYPLALAAGRERAVQPLVLNSGEAITPAIDLCDRKGVYFPDPEALRTGAYPLAYEIIVVYPQNNSRIPVGQKFAELLQTVEGQQLLREAGLVPLNGATP